MPEIVGAMPSIIRQMFSSGIAAGGMIAEDADEVLDLKGRLVTAEIETLVERVNTASRAMAVRVG